MTPWDYQTLRPTASEAMGRTKFFDGDILKVEGVWMVGSSNDLIEGHFIPRTMANAWRNFDLHLAIQIIGFESVCMCWFVLGFRPKLMAPYCIRLHAFQDLNDVRSLSLLLEGVEVELSVVLVVFVEALGLLSYSGFKLIYMYPSRQVWMQKSGRWKGGR